MDNSDDSSDADDHPPKTAHNVRFWFWQSLSWFGYALVSLVYIPWALAVHIALGALAIPLLPLCCMQRGRKVFIYAYVIAVLLPGRFIWFNFLIRNRRRGKVWDFEMGRPRPVPLTSRRRLSQDLSPAGKAFQTPSTFLTKLPPEIRLQIYRHLFVGNSTHFHIVQYKIQGSRTKPPATKIRGYACTREFVGSHSTKCSCILGACGGNNPPHSFDKSCYEDCGGARVAVLQTCRLVYSEAIGVLYTRPTFCLNSLSQPPFFLRSVLPHRLAQIKHIQLCYKTIKAPTHPGTSAAKYFHRVQECEFCNLLHWLKMIKKYMTGLREIEVFFYIVKRMPIPDLGGACIAELVSLQHGPKGLRKMSLKVFAEQMEAQDENYKLVKDFMNGLQGQLRISAGLPAVAKDVERTHATAELQVG